VKRALLLAVPALLLACGPVPGGSLSGTAAGVPRDWSSVLADGKEICEIESRPADPHSIQLECFLFEGGLYVQSHRFALAPWWPESWAEIWIAEPAVRVRLGGNLYDLAAAHVTDPALRERVLRFRGYDPVPDGIAVFRFEPVGPGAGRARTSPLS
jgi:hypothetical protein